MGKIIELPPDVIVKIAAGEVIDSPSAVVRELVDNSIDANAKNVDVSIVEGGISVVEVVDDGEGMDPDDLKVCFKNHSTSKIHSENDLWNISTLGFRGEALASISAVSKLEIISRRKSETSGWKITVEGGKLISFSPSPSKPGTRVVVQDLFFNVPARKKFLRSPQTETRKVREVFVKKSLSFPEVRFSLSVDGKKEITLPSGKFSERVKALFPNVFPNLLEIFEEKEGVKVEGFVSVPAAADVVKNQFFFVNDRIVESPTFYRALYKAFSDVIPRGRHPSAFVRICIPPSEVDVNVHPAKREVRFRRDGFVYHLLFKAFSSALERAGLKGASYYVNFDSQVDYTVQEVVKFSEGAGESNGYHSWKPKISGEADAGKIVFRGSVFGTYLIYEEDDIVYFVDQHAAHERINYDKLKKNLSGKTSQELLVPVVVNIPFDLRDVFSQYSDLLEDVGFEIEWFGEGSLVLRAVPGVKGAVDWKKLVVELLEVLKVKGRGSEKDIMNELLKTMACRMSIKAGDKITYDEAIELWRQLMETDKPFTCPHGRPIVVKFTRSDFEKMFKRKEL